MEQKANTEKKTRKPRTVSLENFDISKLSLEQKLELRMNLDVSIVEDRENFEKKLNLINGKK